MKLRKKQKADEEAKRIGYVFYLCVIQWPNG